MNYLCGRYDWAATTVSDIYQHIPTLKLFSTRCASIAELGVRVPVSTYAFLAGLIDSKQLQRRLWMNDVNPVNEATLELLKTTAGDVGIDVCFQQGSDLQVALPEAGFDMTFIDTWHVYGQLKRELERYAPLTHKFMILHDTTVDGVHGETIRNRWNAEQQSRDTGFTVQEINTGLWPAVLEFLAENSGEWSLLKRYENNNGLTILARNTWLVDEANSEFLKIILK